MDKEPPPGSSEDTGRSGGRGGSAPASSLVRYARRAADACLRHDILWAGLCIIVFVALAWHTPWTEGFEDLAEGHLAQADLIAPFDLDIPDEARTSQSREQARRTVDDVYIFEQKANARLDQEIEEGFASGAPPGAPAPGLLETLTRPGGADLLDVIRRILRDELSEMIVARRDALPQDRGITVRYLGEGAEITLQDPSRIMDLEEARRRAREAVARIGSFDHATAVLAGKWAASLVRPTLTYDLTETLRRKDETARQVPVLYSRTPKGTVLARKGQTLTKDVIREIMAIKKASRPGFDAAALLGMVLVVAFMVFFLWRYASDHRRDFKAVQHLFAFLALALITHAALARGALFVIDRLVINLHFPFDRPETHWYLVPAAAGAVLVTLLAGDRIATVYSVFASAGIAILFDWSLPYAVFTLLTHLAGVYGVSKYRMRTALLKSGLIVGLAGAALAAGLAAVRNGFNPWQVGLTDALFAFLGGAIGVPVVVSFLLPIFEWLFGVLTDIRLLELSNLDNPLLSELALRAPGSYNHSIIVGTLAEAAAEAIGSNALFCRVAAYYHDIGKMKMPEYYIENQKGGENPHDRLVASMSALILSNHVKEGIRLGQEHGLPQAILDIIPQHHGTRVMTYFFEKAKAAALAAAEAPPSEDDFRHPGPKPQTKEAAIFMLADSVEAAARTVSEPNDERFRDLIRQIASRAILEGQFDACDLTFHDLDKITEAFVRCLQSVYHHRIDYPTFIFKGAARRAARPGQARSGAEPGAAGDATT